MEYKAGDLVRIKAMKSGKGYVQYGGKTAMISGWIDDDHYYLNIDNKTHLWPESLLEPYTPKFSVGDRVFIECDRNSGAAKREYAGQYGIITKLYYRDRFFTDQIEYAYFISSEDGEPDMTLNGLNWYESELVFAGSRIDSNKKTELFNNMISGMDGD